MVGVEIATTVRGRALDQAGLEGFWEAAEATGAFVLLHPMRPLPGIDLDRYFLSNAVGRPAETTIALAGLINPIALDYLVRVFGADHVLLGTDYPFPMGDLDPQAFLASVETLTPDQRSAIAGGNAARLFGLD